MPANIGLIVLGALLTAVGIVPIRYAQQGTFPLITSSYVLMMVVPALLALAVAAYQLRRGIDRPSAVTVLVVGAIIGTIPFWGPSFDPGMTMALDGLGTIVAHYLAGLVVAIGAAWQLSLAPRAQAARS